MGMEISTQYIDNKFFIKSYTRSKSVKFVQFAESASPKSASPFPHDTPHK